MDTEQDNSPLANAAGLILDQAAAKWEIRNITNIRKHLMTAYMAAVVDELVLADDIKTAIHACDVEIERLSK